ncbi:Asp-tRNA(Asn)/Glu-tRNA(Gln) amidotransferase subunit GatB [Massiliimalia timonensis]|uniref:Asp-tRNA(Asn)/Glu-tRNA(Gln) amidotransferase subunit GatB n=1 Tax=Massiliimalia timonensis TaxID=1987501 RepID=UPI000B8B74F3|nr:Asp-tRNA(Asn)/Glu-tRNA(Gln) amidotransferase subunit GatB [Massiliimalia timonensis]
MEYEIVVGLEVHAELNTKSKIYCECHNAFGLEVNTQCCPICMGMPGTLPTLNEQVVEKAIKMGHALHCDINRICKQDRKNYFYPDLPKAYQISQFDVPLCEHGYVEVMVEGKVKKFGVTRIHIEEDAGKLLHGGESFEGSLVDFNRCGVPLIEIVSEPDFRSSADAKAYLEALRSILLYLDISDGKMQEGSIRCDVNVSVRPKGSDTFGTRVEMKNVNTFSGAVRAIDYEAARQIEVLENGGTIEQETRRWDDAKGVNILLRSKEDAHDYRYFPEPDLPTIVVPQEKVDELKASITELPNLKVIRYVKEWGISQTDAETIIDNMEKSEWLEAMMKTGNCTAKAAANWILGDISKYMNETGKSLVETKLTPEKMAELISYIEKGKISNAAAKQVFEILLTEDRNPMDVVKEKGLIQISDEGALEKVVADVLANNEKSVADYKNGKTNALGYLTGQCMKATKGQGNPQKLKELLLAALEA